MEAAAMLLLLLGGSCCLLRAGSCRRFSVLKTVCVSSYQDSISCSLNLNHTPAELPRLQLRFTELSVGQPSNYSCQLRPIDVGLGCDCRVKMEYPLMTDDAYAIQLCHASHCQTLIKSFSPSQNIQLTPPSHISVRSWADTLTVTWSSGYQNHLFLSHCLNYELFLHDISAPCPAQPSSPPPASPTLGASQESSAVANCHGKIVPDPESSMNASVSLRRSSLRAGATYCMAVRSIPYPEDYNAIWSRWSPQACWTNPGQEESKLVILTGLLAPLCIAAGLLLFAFHSPATRMKLKAIYQTPTPAPFFKPLFQQHDGNLQAWLSPPGKMALPAAGEESLTISTVIVVPKQREENQELLPPAAAAPSVPFTFPQSPDSYVGVPKPAGPAPHFLAPPLGEPCPVNMSYTSLPCALWGLEGAGGRASATPPPKVLLDVSRSDSGCSCEDLSLSPRWSLPSSPVEAAPPTPTPTPTQPPPTLLPLCLHSDYCVLNKTAAGMVPVLVGKETT